MQRAPEWEASNTGREGVMVSAALENSRGMEGGREYPYPMWLSSGGLYKSTLYA